MGIIAPAAIAGALAATGLDWPDADETAVGTIGDAWEQFAATIDGDGDSVRVLGDRVLDRNEGIAATVLQAWWNSAGAPWRRLEDDVTAAYTVESSLRLFAAAVVTLKTYYLARLTQLQAQLDLLDGLEGPGFLLDLLRRGAVAGAGDDCRDQTRKLMDLVQPILQARLTSAQDLMRVVGERAREQAGADARDLTLQDIADDLAAVNPNFDSGDIDFRVNCVHAVQAYELRRRGYDVEATDLPDRFNHNGRPLGDISDTWGRDFTDGDMGDIVSAFEGYGPGARGVVYINWPSGGAHVFNVENVDGQVVFVDGQTNSSDASGYFDRGTDTSFMRLDDLPTPPVDGTDEFAEGE